MRLADLPHLRISRNAWFESVAVAQRRARRHLPRSVYSALIAGSEAGVTLNDNVAAFEELGFAPRVGGAPAQRDMSATVMGQEVSLPVLISPTGVQSVHPDGGEQIVARIERARAAGARGLIVTLDWSFSHSRDWGSPKIPERMDVRTAIKLLPEALSRPAWFAEWTRAGGPPELTVPNMSERGAPAPTFFGAYGEWMMTPPPSWDDLRWLRERWEGPFMLKGVMRVDDARRAADVGFSAISVSNHGGNNLDGTPAPIRALPAIAAAVGDQVEVLLDGGIRRGSDVVKALALGANAVMIGRAYLWGLAAAGQAGVENVLDVMRAGIDSALLGLGRASTSELTSADLLIPEGFERRLGLTEELVGVTGKR